MPNVSFPYPCIYFFLEPVYWQGTGNSSPYFHVHRKIESMRKKKCGSGNVMKSQKRKIRWQIYVNKINGIRNKNDWTGFWIDFFGLVARYREKLRFRFTILMFKKNLEMETWVQRCLSSNQSGKIVKIRNFSENAHKSFKFLLISPQLVFLYSSKPKLIKK